MYVRPESQRKVYPVKECAATILCLATVLACAGEARADRRIFAYTYPYMTLPGGSFELEHYLDLGLKGTTTAWEGPSATTLQRDWTHPTWQHQVELEYGITDRLDFGFYNVFQQDASGALQFEGVKVRSRYRFADPGVHAVDAGVYLEYVYFGDMMEIEQRLILSKILGRVEVACNAMVEEEIELGPKEWEYVFTPSLGVGYHFSPGFAAGVEYVGRMLIAEESLAYYASYLGPGISVAAGPFYWTLAAEAQLGRHSNLAAVQIRSLFGIVL
jgi:hypothetical protein